jgi:hypothetical protein
MKKEENVRMLSGKGHKRLFHRASNRYNGGISPSWALAWMTLCSQRAQFPVYTRSLTMRTIQKSVRALVICCNGTCSLTAFTNGRKRLKLYYVKQFVND